MFIRAVASSLVSSPDLPKQADHDSSNFCLFLVSATRCAVSQEVVAAFVGDALRVTRLHAAG